MQVTLACFIAIKKGSKRVIGSDGLVQMGEEETPDTPRVQQELQHKPAGRSRGQGLRGQWEQSSARKVRLRQKQTGHEVSGFLSSKNRVEMSVAFSRYPFLLQKRAWLQQLCNLGDRV